MRAILILVVFVVGQTTSEIPNDPVLKEKVMFYMPSLLVKPKGNLYQVYGLNLIKYGYINSNCEHPQDEDFAKEKTTNGQYLWKWRPKVDVKDLMSFFYEYRILPEGEEDGLTLWYNLVLFYQEFILFKPLDGFYTIYQLRGCPTKGKYCDRKLPERPKDIQFTERQCKKVSLFIKDMSFRMDKPDENVIPYTIPFDFYCIGIYLAKRYPISEEDSEIDVAKMKKLLEFEEYLNGKLQLDKEDCIKKYSTFLTHRNEKEALLEADLKEASDEHTIKVREEKLHFHQTVSKMMVGGWEYVKK